MSDIINMLNEHEFESKASVDIVDELMKTPTKASNEKKNRTPIKFSKTGESIYNRGKEFLSSVEVKRQEIANNEHSFKPKINEKSAKMLQNAMKEGRNPRDKKAKEEIRPEVEEEEKKIKPKGDIKGFIERNYTNAVANKKPVEKNETLDAECTFKPKMCDKSKELASSLHADLFKQAEDLKRKKQEKIDQALKQKAEKELDGCTFKPQISKPANNYSPQAKVKKGAELQFGYSKNKTHRLFIDI